MVLGRLKEERLIYERIKMLFTKKEEVIRHNISMLVIREAN